MKDLILNISLNLGDVSDLYGIGVPSYDEYGDLYDDKHPSPQEAFSEIIKKAVGEHILSRVYDKEVKAITLVLEEQAKQSIDLKIRSHFDSLMNEDISITDDWGKLSFVGTIDDYIKKRIDEVLLIPVDNNGQQLKGACSSSSKTYVKWKLESDLENMATDTVKYLIERAKKEIKKSIETQFKEELSRVKIEATAQALQLLKDKI